MEPKTEEKRLATQEQEDDKIEVNQHVQPEMDFAAPDDDNEPVEHARDQKQPKRSTIVLQSNSKGRRLKRMIKCLPLSRRELENLKDFKALNAFQDQSSIQQLFSCVFCMYWLTNTVAGLYTVHMYNDYLSQEYPNLQLNIIVFATKWFSSIALTAALLVVIALGSLSFFQSQSNSLKQQVVGLALPVYFTCVVIQQVFSSGYGTWFFLNLHDLAATAGDKKFSEMDGDCLDLVKFFFANEVIVGYLTLFQCFVLMCCGYMKSRHLREIEGEVDMNEKRTKYYLSEIQQSRLKSIRQQSTRSSSGKKKKVSFKEFKDEPEVYEQQVDDEAQ